MSIDTTNLPTINEEMEESLRKQNKLHLEILRLLQVFNEENNLTTYETDAVLLSIMTSNHKGYLKMKYREEE